MTHSPISKYTKTPNYGLSPINPTKRDITPPCYLPLHTKLSNQLLQNMPIDNLKSVYSYSSLLNQQRNNEFHKEKIIKNLVTSYKAHSTFLSKSKISMNNIEYAANKKYEKKIIKGRLIKNAWKSRKIEGWRGLDPIPNKETKH